MRKTVSKIIMVLAMLALVFAITACNRGDDPAPSPAPNQPGQTANNQQQTPGNQQQEPTGPVVPTIPMGNIHPIIDMGGRHIRIASWYFHTFNGAARGAIGHENPLNPESAMYAMELLQYENRKRVEEQFNVTIELLNMGWSGLIDAFYAGQAAGTPIGEFVHIMDDLLVGSIAGDHLIDIRTLVHPFADQGFAFDFHTDNKFIQPTNITAGRQWSIVTSAPQGLRHMLAVNMDLVRQLGLPNPVELYNNGNWTWDSMLNVMRLAKNQGYFGMSGQTGQVARMLSGANDAVWVDSNFNAAFTHPNTVYIFEWFMQMMDESLWHYDETVGKAGTNYAWADRAFRELGQSVFSAQGGHLVHIDDIPFDFVVLPMPLGPNNTTGTTAHTPLVHGMSIPVGTERPEELLIIMEELYSWSQGNEWMLEESVLDGLRARLRYEECVQRAFYYGNNTVVADIGWSAIMRGPNWMWYGIIDNMINGLDSATNLLESRRPGVQESMDTLFGHLR
jgi:multiple sugar transport system substrate-binding protein